MTKIPKLNDPNFIFKRGEILKEEMNNFSYILILGPGDFANVTLATYRVWDISKNQFGDWHKNYVELYCTKVGETGEEMNAI